MVGQRFRKALTPSQGGTGDLRGNDGGQELLVGKHITALFFLSKVLPTRGGNAADTPLCRPVAGARDDEQGACEAAAECVL